jgi:pyruvate/2-oxoglutarate dehydrogenase complex dihydrolipoamide acyltransferase (E2) component
VSLWLLPPGTRVAAGDRVVELVAGGVTIDLQSPVSGRLVAQLVDEDEPITPGMVVAEFEADP